MTAKPSTPLDDAAEAARVAAEEAAGALETKTPEELAAVEAEAAKIVAEAAVKKVPAKDWKDDRIATLTAKLAEQRRVNDEQQKKLASTPAGAATPEQLAEAEIEKRALALAEKKVSQALWDRQCDDAVAQGKKDFGAVEFDQNLSALREAVLIPGDKESAQQFADLVAVMLETGEAPKLIFELGADPAKATELVKLTPARRVMELTKMAIVPKQKLDEALAGEPEDKGNDLLAPVNPKPITPIGNRAGPHTSITASDPRSKTLSSAEWHRRRNAEVNAAQEARAKQGVRLH